MQYIDVLAYHIILTILETLNGSVKFCAVTGSKSLATGSEKEMCPSEAGLLLSWNRSILWLLFQSYCITSVSWNPYIWRN